MKGGRSVLIAQYGRPNVEQARVEVIHVLMSEQDVFELIERASILDQVGREVRSKVDGVARSTLGFVVQVEMDRAACADVASPIKPCFLADAAGAKWARDGFSCG